MRRKDARPRQTAEDTKVEHEQQLIDDGNRGHLQRADAPDHHVIQQTDNIENRVLNDNRYDDRYHFGIKRFIANQSLQLRAFV